MKILFVANRLPYPPFRGDKLKIFNLAKHLHHTHELHLVTFAESADDQQYIPNLAPYFKRIHLVELPKWQSVVNAGLALLSGEPLQVGYFKSAKMQALISYLLQQESFDAVHVQHIRMAPYLKDIHSVPRILDLPDAFSLYWKRRQDIPGLFWKKQLERLEQKRLFKYERLLNNFDLTLVCSQEDQQYLKNAHHIDRISVLPNGVDTEQFNNPQGHDYAQQINILFTGNMDYAPNVDAVVYFVESIFPHILNVFPQAKFIIGGQRPVKAVQALASEQVIVTGFIEKLQELYKQAAIVVAPLRFGAGTQNKVLEAMAMGIPVVCTHVGFEGLGVVSGDGVYKETDAQAFADRVIQLLSDESLRRAVGEKGKATIHNRFGWSQIAALLDRYFQSIQK